MGIVMKIVKWKLTCVEQKSTWGMKNIKMGINKMKIVYSMWKVCFTVVRLGSVMV